MIIILFPRSTKLGSTGRDVYAMKRALSRAGFGTWIGYKFTPLYGKYTEILLSRFKKKHGIVEKGYGPKTHKALAKHYDAFGAKMMNDLYLKLHETPSSKLVKAALEIYNYCRLTGRGVYTQSPSRMSIVRHRWRPPFNPHTLYEDCSSSVTAVFWLCGFTDPNGFGYNGQGYTGTLVVHGYRSTPAKVGALGFYASRFPYKHVVMCVKIIDGRALCFSWGSGLPKLVNSNYRGDFSHWRVYVTA